MFIKSIPERNGFARSLACGYFSLLIQSLLGLCYHSFVLLDEALDLSMAPLLIPFVERVRQICEKPIPIKSVPNFFADILFVVTFRGLY